MDRDTKCHAIIHTASASAAAIGAGLAQIPLADTIPLTGIQVGMIISIANVFDVDLAEGAAKALLGGFAASTTGRAISQTLLGWIPVIGNTINASTAGAITETIGWAAVSHFENLESEKKRNFNSGYQCGERDTKEKFNDILKKLKKNEMDNCLVVVIFKYTMTKVGFNEYINFNKINPQISELIENINNEFDEDFTLAEIEEFFNDWKEYNKEKRKDKIYSILKEAMDIFNWKNFDQKKYLEIIKYIEENM